MKRLILGALILSPALIAQDDAKPITIGNFENQGSATFGYRFTSVKGYEPKFNELFNLRDGPRLLDFSLFGKAPEGKGRFADDYSLTGSGLGGDPFSTIQMTVRKSQLYDLRVNFRQSYYYWNRNDSAALPSGLNSLTSNHDWATVRKLGSINLLVHASRNLRVSLEYFRNTRDGTTNTTRSLDYFGAPSTWGGYARANSYYVLAPSTEVANRGTVGLDYTLRDWTLHYKAGYQSFTDTINGGNLLSPQRSINVDDANTVREPINSLAWNDYRELKTPVSEFSYTGKITPSFRARGGYLFYRYSGPAALDMAFTGAARTTSAAVTAPFNVGLTTEAHVTEPNHVIDQGFTYKVKEWWDVLVDYRYSRFTVDSTADFRSVSGATIATGESTTQWRLGTSSLDFNMAFTPFSSLLVRTGVRLMKMDVVMLDDGVTDFTRTKRINSVWPIASVHWEPSKKFTVRGDIDQITNGTSYTRVTPHTDVGGRIVARYRPTEKLYIEDAVIVRNRRLLASDYRSNVRSNAATINYDVAERLALFAGFSYDSFFAANYVSFLRGTAPFANLALRDQTVNRVWSGGVRAHPTKRLGLTFTGNFVRTTGVGEIFGEAPLYGPMTFPYGTGSLYYDFPKFGRLTAQLQRTYYAEQFVPGNNFSANILSLAWTRSF